MGSMVNELDMGYGMRDMGCRIKWAFKTISFVMSLVRAHSLFL